jgi:hypothetical protein
MVGHYRRTNFVGVGFGWHVRLVGCFMPESLMGARARRSLFAFDARGMVLLERSMGFGIFGCRMA